MTARDVVQVSFPDVQMPVDEMVRGRLIAVHRDAERWFRRQLDSSWVPEYLRSRRLDGCLSMSSPWAVGYAPAKWLALTDHLRGLGYTDRDILDAGLGLRSKHGTVVDRFRDRLMVSARNADGETVGFVGRADPASDGQRRAKYLNSPETAIYRKGEVLLGLSEHRDLLLAGARAVVVEGAFDAMALTAASDGRYAGVAPSGTAVTEMQMRELRPVAGTEVVFALDGDMSGRLAVVRAHAVAHRAGFDSPRAAVLPTGCDPADMWSGGRVTSLVDVLDDAPPAADLVVDARLDEWPHGLDSSHERINAARSVAAVVARLPAGEVARQVGRVALRLGLTVATVTVAVTDAVSPPDQPPVAVRARGRHVGLVR